MPKYDFHFWFNGIEKRLILLLAEHPSEINFENRMISSTSWARFINFFSADCLHLLHNTVWLPQRKECKNPGLAYIIRRFSSSSNISARRHYLQEGVLRNRSRLSQSKASGSILLPASAKVGERLWNCFSTTRGTTQSTFSLFGFASSVAPPAEEEGSRTQVWVDDGDIHAHEGDVDAQV